MNLLMLTKFYPYGTGEAFIENEIKVFSEYFEEITIISCEVPREEQRIRETPDNVTVYRIDAGNKKQDALKGLLKNIVSNKSELKREQKGCKGIRKRGFLYYFEEKSQRVFREILEKKYLKNITAKPYMLYSYWLFMTARVGTLISMKYKPVFMFTRTHRYDLYENRNALNYLPYREFLLNNFDYIFPCSDNGTQYLQKKYPKYVDKIRTAFLGTIDHGKGVSSKDGVFRIVSCSRIAPEKRVERIAETLEILDSCNLNLEWHHIGDGDSLEKIKSICREFTSIKCVFYGNVPNAEVLKKYEKEPFDLFVNVSSSEGLPVSIMEAISFGMPVIATNVGGTNEIVFNGVTGQLLIEDFDNAMFAEEIKKFVNMDCKEYSCYRDRCRSKWEESFQANTNYNQLCGFLMEKEII
ncbi:glycosyltransferase [Enterococcus faecium]|uniref:glycosyltransferase n=1 Tax=Enterococcus faecium TaxID=1352 RepID=UPI00227DBBB9|nr:glycosyltransferase [Enterococcus faecium]MCU1817698.1 glycosyltransferase [Enterococcus faecium]MCY7002402.1 glycosyltransferase [Enterococcus faecium]HAP8953294.1 glycosyltransferase [Enterococcus faecium]